MSTELALAGQPLAMSCEFTQGNPRLVSSRQTLLIEAPLERVAAVLEDFEHYQEISPSFDDIRVVIRTSRDSVLTSWTRHVPFFFLPNMRYELRYRIDRTHTGRIEYRSTLEKSSHLEAASSLIVLEAAGPSTTRMERHDLIGPPAGVFAAAPPGQIWESTLGDLYFSGTAIKLRAEHRDWDASHIVTEARRLLDRFSIDELRRHCHERGLDAK